MTVLVTGATGFLGSRVVEQLLDTGHEVRVMVRRPGRESVFASPPTDVCYGDISDPDALSEACRDITAVIHLVAVIRGGQKQFDAINRQGTANVVAAAKAAGSVRRFIHVSAVGANNTPPFAIPLLQVAGRARSHQRRRALHHHSAIFDFRAG